MNAHDELLENLRRHSAPRAIVRVIPGRGTRSALVTWLAEEADRGRVLVTAPSAQLVDQWAARFRSAGLSPHVLGSTADALELRSRAADQRRRGLVLCTFARARTGQAATALRESTLDLVIFDEAVGTIPAKLATALASAGRSVALVVGSAPLEWPGAVEVNPITPSEFRRALGDVRIQNVHYDASHEPPTVQEARALLRRRFPSALWGSGSPALLHASLLNLVANAEVDDPNSPIHPVGASPRSEQEPQLDPAEVWRLIDGLEGLAGQADARLVALDEVLSDQDLRWVISVVARADAAYLVDHIRTQGRLVQALTGELSFGERAAVLDDPPHIIVGTVPVIAALPRWPRGYGAIWWSPPRSDAELEQRLARMAGYERIEVVQFVAS